MRLLACWACLSEDLRSVNSVLHVPFSSRTLRTYYLLFSFLFSLFLPQRRVIQIAFFEPPVTGKLKLLFLIIYQCHKFDVGQIDIACQ